MVGLANMVTGKQPGARTAKAAAASQREAMAQQEAVQARAQLRENQREQDLSAQSATQRRVIAARRNGGQLSFMGPNTGLKTTFGG